MYLNIFPCKFHLNVQLSNEMENQRNNGQTNFLWISEKEFQYNLIPLQFHVQIVFNTMLPVVVVQYSLVM